MQLRNTSMKTLFLWAERHEKGTWGSGLQYLGYPHLSGWWNSLTSRALVPRSCVLECPVLSSHQIGSSAHCWVWPTLDRLPWQSLSIWFLDFTTSLLVASSSWRRSMKSLASLEELARQSDWGLAEEHSIQTLVLRAAPWLPASSLSCSMIRPIEEIRKLSWLASLFF